jgi:hypothetical protein
VGGWSAGLCVAPAGAGRRLSAAGRSGQPASGRGRREAATWPAGEAGSPGGRLSLLPGQAPARAGGREGRGAAGPAGGRRPRMGREAGRPLGGRWGPRWCRPGGRSMTTFMKVSKYLSGRRLRIGDRPQTYGQTHAAQGPGWGPRGRPGGPQGARRAPRESGGRGGGPAAPGRHCVGDCYATRHFQEWSVRVYSARRTVHSECTLPPTLAGLHLHAASSTWDGPSTPTGHRRKSRNNQSWTKEV